MNKQKYLADLREGIVEVTFKKVSGTERTMKCTLNGGYLPLTPDSAAFNRLKNDDVCSVWSIDDGGWRSFRWDSVLSWETNKISLPEIHTSSADDAE